MRVQLLWECPRGAQSCFLSLVWAQVCTSGHKGAMESPVNTNTIWQTPDLFSSPPFQLLTPSAITITNSFLPPTRRERLNASLIILQLSSLSHLACEFLPPLLAPWPRSLQDQLTAATPLQNPMPGKVHQSKMGSAVQSVSAAFPTPPES